MSTVDQDLTAQREAFTAPGVDPKRIYVDHGLTGTNRDRPGLCQALACRSGDTLVVTKLDRLARSVPDARDIVDELTANGVRLNIGGSVHDPSDPVGRLLFTTLKDRYQSTCGGAGRSSAEADRRRIGSTSWAAEFRDCRRQFRDPRETAHRAATECGRHWSDGRRHGADSDGPSRGEPCVERPA